MAYRLIALDLDGTALDSRLTVRPATKAVLTEARSRGIQTILVSGRHHGAILPYHRELDLDTPVICCNGAYIYGVMEKAPLVGSPIAKATAGALLEMCRRRHLHTLVYADDDMNFEESSPHLERLIAWGAHLPGSIRPTFRRVERFEETLTAATAIWKFLITSVDRAAMDAAVIEMRTIGALNIERSWSDRLDVVAGGNTKGERLSQWAKTQGIAVSEIVAFGDNQNDIDMLRTAGLGVAMGGAEETVRAAADLTVDGNNTDTIAETLHAYVLHSGPT